MRVKIISAAKVRNREIEILEGEYLKRLKFLQVIELSSRTKSPEPRVQQKAEGAGLLQAAADCDLIVSMDESGKLLDSAHFAEKFGSWLNQGKSSFAFLIGGAYGLSDEVKAKSTFVWSLSPLTFPFHIARLLTVEQFYRAFCNINGHPYHK